MESNETGAESRIDKWLWAARFFKTRALAAEAVTGGKVEINGARGKPGRAVHVGDRLSIRRGPYVWTVVVEGTAKHRGPAPQAQTLYTETAESRRTREETAVRLRLERPPELNFPGRPSKKDRRAILRFTKRS